MKELTKILICDDDDLLRGTLVEYLMSSKFGIENFSNPKLFLDTSPKLDEYKLVITDKDMPNMKGTEFAKYLRNNGYKNPIIIMSGEFDDAIINAYRKELESSGLNNFYLYSKGFGISELIS